MTKLTITKHTVNIPARKLNTTWTVEPILDFSHPDFIEVSVREYAGEKWYLVMAFQQPIIDWIRGQSNELWKQDDEGEIIMSTAFVLHEKLYSFFKLRWSE